MAIIFKDAPGGGGGGGDLFNMDLSSGAQSLAGFDAVSGSSEIGVSWSRSYSSTGGPSNGPYYRFTQLYDASQQNATPDGYGGNYYLGWGVDMGAGNVPSTGQSRFVRLRVRLGSTTNNRAINENDGSSPAVTRTKLFIFGDGDTGRTILELQGTPDQSTWDVRISRDGGSQGEVAVNIGDWINVQTETVCGAGGALKMWVNNNTYASPNVNATGLAMGAGQYRFFGLGYYTNRMVASDGVCLIDFGACEIGTTFSSTWN